VTAVDTNVLVALLNLDEALSSKAEESLNRCMAGGLVIAGPVWAELRAFPTRNDAMLEEFLSLKEIRVDWEMHESVWRLAGRAFQEFNLRRKRSGSDLARRLLTDFVIGAHAMSAAHALLTLDQRHYRAAYPNLRIAGF